MQSLTRDQVNIVAGGRENVPGACSPGTLIGATFGGFATGAVGGASAGIYGVVGGAIFGAALGASAAAVGCAVDASTSRGDKYIMATSYDNFDTA